MASNCSDIPQLTDPPQTDPSGKWLYVINAEGETRKLARLPDGEKGILVFDGDDIYFATGSEDLPVSLSELILVNEIGENEDGDEIELNGVLSLDAAGMFYRSVNEDDTDPKVLMSLDGKTFWGDGLPIGGDVVPTIGFGVVVRLEADTPVIFLGGDNPSILSFDGDGKPQKIKGTAGQILMITNIGGANTPTWVDLPSGNIATGSNSATLDALRAASISISQVNITCPSMKLTDGATTIDVANVNVTVNLTNPVGLLGLDTGAEQADKWYYIYVISNGTLISAIISLSATIPDLTSTGGYTYYGFASVFRNNSSGDIRTFTQKGRQFWTVPIQWGTDMSVTTAFNNIVGGVNLNTILPPIVGSCSGNVGGSTSAVNSVSVIVAANIAGIALQAVGREAITGTVEGFKQDIGHFNDIPILDPASPSLAWRSDSNNTKRRLVITGYKV